MGRSWRAISIALALALSVAIVAWLASSGRARSSTPTSADTALDRSQDRESLPTRERRASDSAEPTRVAAEPDESSEGAPIDAGIDAPRVGVELLRVLGVEQDDQSLLPSGERAGGTPTHSGSLGRLRGEVIDARTGLPIACEVVVTGAPEGHWMSLRSSDGIFEQDRLDAGTYAVIASTMDGRVGMTRDVVVSAGDLTDGVRVEVDVGVTLRVLAQESLDQTVVEIRVDGFVFDWFSARAGTPMVRNVPAGDLELRWGGSSTGATAAPAGREVELEIP